MNRPVCSLLVFLFFSAAAFAQSNSSLSGVAIDPSGAVIPGVDITLLNTANGATRHGVSDGAGRYNFAEVQPGGYRILAKAKGFADVLVDGVKLLVATPATVNVVFEKVGSTSETVSVSAEAAQINTTDASIGNAIGEKPIVQLPLEARNVVGLLSLQPGVTYFADPSVRNDYRSGAVNGGKSDQSNVLLDGVDVNDQQSRAAFTSVLRVTLDSVQEFRTTTTNGGADQGRTSGAQVSLVTKSGTNAYHGALYEYTRNTLTSANSFFNNSAGVSRQKLIRNVYGASLGGPVKKDRLFFFMNYEGRRDASDSSAVRIVPNDLFRQGIFSYKLTDGSTGQLTPAQIAQQVDPIGIGPSAAVLTLLQQYPHPNDNSVGDGLNTAGYRFKSSAPLRYNTYIARLDYQLDQTGNHRVFWRGNLQNDHVTSSIPQFPGQADAQVHLENSKGFAAGYTWVASANLVNNLHYGLTRQGYTNTGVQKTPYVTLRDIDDIYASTRNLDALIPVHQISDDVSWTHGAHNLQFGGVMRFIGVTRNDQGNSFSDGFANSSWFADTGGSLMVPNADPNYQTVYVRKMTDLLGIVSEGDAYYNYDKAGNLLPQGAAIKRKYVDNEYELYLMDTWKVSRGLTISGGIRASLFPPLYEANGYQTSANLPLGRWFDIRGGLAQQGLPQSQAPALSYNLSSAPGGSGLYPFQKHFAPRVSIAYSPQGDGDWSRRLFGGPGRTSIRMGWGMYYDLFGQSLIQLANATALGFSSQLSNAASASEATAPRFISPTQIPAGLLPRAPQGGFPQAPPSIFAITTGVDSNLQAPYTMNANFSIGREFGHGFFVQGSYIGRFSRHSLQGDDVAIPTNLRDTISGTDYFTAAALMQKYVRANAAVGSVPAIPWFENIFPGYAGGGLTATQNIFQNFWLPAGVGNDTTGLAFIDDGPTYGCSPCSKFGPNALYNPQYGSLAVYRSRGAGNYHSMQWTVRKEFSDGLQFDLNYSFSKGIDLGSTRETDGRVVSQIVNPWNPSQMKAVSDYDVRHIVSAFMVAELPFGRGKKFGGNVNRLVDAFIGGWQWGGIWRQSSGLPVGVDNGGFWSTNWNVEGYATHLRPTASGVTKNSSSGGPNIFANPSAAFGTFGLTFPGQSGSRNVIRGGGFFTIDMSLDKRFKMPWSEKQSVQIRAESFNVTNTASFDVNQSTLGLGDRGAFGKYNGTLGTPRVFQFGARYEF